MKRIPVKRRSAVLSQPAADKAEPSLPLQTFATVAPPPGTLYLVPMPIGNPDDISLRGLQILREVVCIGVETLAVARRMMAHWSIKTPLLSYGGKAGAENKAKLLSLLQTGGNVALICDAGTPGIADPCPALVRAALQQNSRITSLPGPAAALVALAASGFSADRFIFDGFPPLDSDDRRRFFQKLAYEERATILYEHAACLRATLNDLQQALGSQRQVAIAWNLTRPTETWLRGTPQEILARLRRHIRRGEITLVISGKNA